MKKQKVVITGGAGFVGTHLARALLAKDFKVVCIDNLISGKRENIPEDALFIHGDIRDSRVLKEAFSGADFIFHLAALPSVPYSIDNPEETHDVNVNGTLSVLQAAKHARVKKLIFASSCSIYGDQLKKNLKESFTAHPQSPYALHKRIGEEMMLLWSTLYKINTISLRFFNIYGPGQAEEGAYAFVIAKFLRLKREHKHLTVTGKGDQTRDFVHVSDVVDACIKSMHLKTIPGDIINIGYGRGISIKDIAHMVGGDIQHIDARIEPHNAQADINKAKKVLKWRPVVAVKDGIDQLLTLEKYLSKSKATPANAAIKIKGSAGKR